MAENKIRKEDISEEDVFGLIGESAEKNLAKVDKFNATLDEYAKKLKVIFKAAKPDSLQGINQMVNLSAELNRVTEEAVKTDKEKVKTTEALRKAQEALTLERAKEQEALKKRNQEIRQQAKLELAQKGTIEAVRAELAIVSREWAALTKVEGENSKQAIELGQTKKRLTDQLKELEAATSDHRRNVGNYTDAVKPLKVQLRELTQALQMMDSSDPEFARMAAEAGQLRDTINDTKGVIEATAGSGIENMSKGLAGVGQIGVNAFQGVEGAMALFGTESEAVMQTLMKLQALAAMSDALEGLGGLGDKITEIKASFTAAAAQLGLFTSAKKADTVITNGQTAATTVATTATKGLGSAMKALPIVAIIAGIAGLVAMVYNLASAHAEARRQQDMYKESVKQGEQIAKEAIDKETQLVEAKLKALDQEMRKRKAMGEDAKKLTAEQLKREKEILESSKLNIDQRIKYSNRQYAAAKKDADRLAVLLRDKEANWNELNTLVDKYNARVKDAGQDPFVNLQDTLNSKMTRNAKVVKDLTVLQADLNDELTENEISTLEASKATADYTVKVTNHNAAKTEENKLLVSNSKLLEREVELRESLFDPDATAESLLMDERRAVLAADIAVIEAEIALSKAQQSGDTAAILKAEEQLAKAREGQIKAQLQLDLAQTDNPNERLKLEKQAELDILNASNKKVEENQQELKETFEKYGNEILDGFVERSQKRQEILQKELDASKAHEDFLRELAVNGNADAQQSLAAQEQISNEKTRALEREAKKQAQLEEMKVIYNSILQFMEKGDSLPTATVKSIAGSFGIRKLIAALPAFFKGTEDTGTGGGVDGKGGFLSVLHPHERVVPRALNEQLDGVANDELVQGFLKYKDFANGLMVHEQPATKRHAGQDPTVHKLDTLISVVKNKKETHFSSDVRMGIARGLVVTEKQGLTRTRTHYRP